MFIGEVFTSPIRELYLSNDAFFKRFSTRFIFHMAVTTGSLTLSSGMKPDFFL